MSPESSPSSRLPASRAASQVAALADVIGGSVTNDGLPISGPRRVHRYGPGDGFSFPGSGIHRMDHDPGSITIHVYSPPLRAIGYYEVVDGLLQRTPGPPHEASPESPRLLAALRG